LRQANAVACAKSSKPVGVGALHKDWMSE
jgi:hypothetical protein